MSEESPKSFKRVLDPMERISEVLFGLIMVLCITGSISVAEAGREQVRTMLIGALGCNLAWGIVDGIFYLMNSLSEREHGRVMLTALHKAADRREAYGLIAAALPPVLASALSSAEFELMRERLNRLPEPPVSLRFTRDDWLGAAGVFLLVVGSTFPVAIPFIFIGEPRLALHMSNAVAIVLLFVTGSAFGRRVGRRPWRTGLLMVVVGATLVAITKALGG